MMDLIGGFEDDRPIISVRHGVSNPPIENLNHYLYLQQPGKALYTLFGALYLGVSCPTAAILF